MDVVNDVFIHSSSKPKYFSTLFSDWDNKKRTIDANKANAGKLAMHFNDQKLNEKKDEDTISSIECMEEAKDKDWKRWDTGKNRKVKRSKVPFTELIVAVDIGDLPGRVYTQMDVTNEVLKPPTNIVQPNPKPKYVAWDVHREERINRAEEARKRAFGLKDQKRNEKKNEDILSANNSDKRQRDTKCSNKEEMKETGKDRNTFYNQEDNDDMATCSCGLMKLFQSFFRKSKK